MPHPPELPEYLERCLAAPTPEALRDEALKLPSVIPGEIAWLEESDEHGHLSVYGPDLSAEQRAALESMHAEHPLLSRSSPEPRAPAHVPDTGAFRRTEPASRFHGPLGLRDALVMPLDAQDQAALLVLGRAQSDFTADDRATAHLIQAVVSAAFHRVTSLAPLRTAQDVARQQLRTAGRTLVLLVDADGRLHGEGADLLPPDVRTQVEALVEGEAAHDLTRSGDAAAVSREIMLVRNSADENFGLMSLKVLPPDDDGISCVLIRLPADAAHLEKHGLSSRQAEVMAQVLAGADSAEISRRLGISSATVRKHTENAYRTLGVRSLTEFALRVL